MQTLKFDYMEKESRFSNKFEMSAQIKQASQQASQSSLVWSDWHVLFNAVKARLKSTVVQQLTTGQSGHPDALEQVCAVVLECLAELEQLQNSLQNEIERYRSPPRNG